MGHTPWAPNRPPQRHPSPARFSGRRYRPESYVGVRSRLVRERTWLHGSFESTYEDAVDSLTSKWHVASSGRPHKKAKEMRYD